MQILQLGGLLNAIGNVLVLPFTLIYLHNERGIDLGTAGLVLATNAAVSLVAGPIAGALVDRVGGKRMLTIALCFLSSGSAVTRSSRPPGRVSSPRPSSGSATAPSGRPNRRSSPGCAREQRPATFAMQRVTMNLGIGIGGLAGGLIASESFRRSSSSTRSPSWATRLCSGLRSRAAAGDRTRTERSGSYRDVLRHRVFMGLMAVNALFIAAGIAQLEVLPAYAKNEAGIARRGIGQLFFINTVAVVVLQLPIARLARVTGG